MKLFSNLFFSDLDYSIYESYNYICESIGIFKDCDKIVSTIINKIQDINDYDNELTIQSSDIKELTNDFFNKIIIIFDKTKKPDKKPKASCKEGGYDEDIQKIDTIYIKLFINHFDISNVNFLNELLTHELTHSWDWYIVSKNFNYNKYKGKDADTYKLKTQKMTGKIVVKTTEDQFRAWKYIQSLLGNHNETPSKENIIKYEEFAKSMKDIFYYLIKTEENAFISALEPGLHGKSFKNIKDAINYLNNNSQPYKAYKILYHFANDDDGKNLKELKFSDTLIKKIQKETNRVWKKIINHVYHACEKHIK